MAGEGAFLQKQFQEYYRKNFIAGPPSIGQREFGVGTFENKIAMRHLSFKSPEDFNYFLRNQTPFYVSYSNAYYEFPEGRPMEAKHFLQADLVYEFDADDIPTSCKETHDTWSCRRCGASGKGAIEKCTSCGERVSVQQFFCGECLGEAKKQVFRLLDFLQDDFGFSEGISVNFSGRAGYHIHLREEKVRGLPQSARVELIDYLTANGLDISMLGFSPQGKIMQCPRPSAASGWGKRIIEELLQILEKEDSDRISSVAGFSHKKVDDFLKQKGKILESIESGRLYAFPGKDGPRFWNSLLEYIVQQLSLRIDRQTSVDISKILRVPDTIHGSSGLLAKSVPLEGLRDFDPFEDAIAFGSEPVKVFIKDAPKFILGKESFGPFKEALTELPLFAAVYLLAGRRAVLAEVA